MISYEIRKKRPEPEHPPNVPATRYRNVGDVVRESRMNREQAQAAWIPAAQREQQQQEQTEYPITRRSSGTPITAISMGKIGYSRWLDEMVHPYFHKGQWVTLKSHAYTIGEIPPFVLQVLDINELYYDVEMDFTSREPRAVFVKSLSGLLSTYYPPCKLRPLNTEEVKLLDKLRNQEAPVIDPADNPAAGSDAGGKTEVSASERDADEPPPNEEYSA